MKIAFISQPLDRVLPPSQNSIGIWIYEVARRLAQHHEVHIYSNGGLKPPRSRVIDGVHYHFIRALPFHMGQKFQALISRFLPANKPFFSSSIFTSNYALQAGLDIQRRHLDVVHIVNFSQYVPIVRAFAPHATIVLNMQCEWLSQLDHHMIAARLRQTDLVVGCSEYITQKVRDRFPEYAERCTTVFNGVDENVFSPLKERRKPGPRRLLFVSRLSPEKGVHVLLRAFRKVYERFPDTELHLIGATGAAPFEFLVKMTDDQQVAQLAQYYGSTPYIEQLRKEIPPQLTSQVIFHGHMNRKYIPEHFRQADILINPSISEPFGMALVEGMSAGLPVVAARAGGMVEIIDEGETGYLVNTGDSDHLADTLIHLLKNDALRTYMGKAGRQRVLETFSWDRIVDSLLLQYGKVYATEPEPCPAETVS